MKVKNLKEILNTFDDEVEVCEIVKSFGNWTLIEIENIGYDADKKFIWFDGPNPTVEIGTVDRKTLKVRINQKTGALYIGDLING